MKKKMMMKHSSAEQITILLLAHVCIHAGETITMEYQTLGIAESTIR